jgi:hypothetical protein
MVGLSTLEAGLRHLARFSVPGDIGEPVPG